MGDDETNRAIRAKSIHGKQEQTETSDCSRRRLQRSNVPGWTNGSFSLNVPPE